MLKFNRVISALVVTFFVNDFVLAHPVHAQNQHSHGQEEEHAAIEFVRAEVVQVDLAHNELVLRHEAIKHLDMAAMTMAFGVADHIDITELSEGDQIKVRVEHQTGDFVIIEMRTKRT